MYFKTFSEADPTVGGDDDVLPKPNIAVAIYFLSSATKNNKIK